MYYQYQLKYLTGAVLNQGKVCVATRRQGAYRAVVVVECVGGSLAPSQYCSQKTELFSVILS